MNASPAYLTAPDTSGITYGRLRWQDGRYVIYDASPAVFEMAKRVFPGCNPNRVSGEVWFSATRRVIGDLNWLMTRYPLAIDEPERYERHRSGAVEHAALRDENQRTTAPLDPPDTFDGTLHRFQAEGVRFLNINDRTLLADDMGLGKTVTALASMVAADAQGSAFPALICVPPNVREQWVRSVGKFLNITGPGQLTRDASGESLCEVLTGQVARELSDKPIYLTSYNLLQYWADAIRERGVRTVIFDEIQELRHTGTLKYSAASLIAGDAERVWGLSGTPIYNHGIEIWSVLNIIDYHCLGDRDSFTREWCDGYGSERVSKPEALNDHLRREGLMIRRRKSQVMSELPPKHRVAHVIEHDADKYGQLIAHAKDLASRYSEIRGWHERGEASLRIEQETRLATGVAKAPYAGDFIATLLEAGERPLIYAWHHDVHDEIAERLSAYRIGRVTGKETQKQKRRTIDRFAAGELDAVLLSLRATAGIDGLQSRATTVVFAELDWSPAIHSQCEDRLHRVGVGDLDQVMCYYLVSRTGYDGVVKDALGVKIGQFVGIMGDDAETEDDKRISEQRAKEHLKRVIARLSHECTAEVACA